MTIFVFAADDDEPIPLVDVKANVLEKVLEFCKHHVDNPLPEIEKVNFRFAVVDMHCL